MRAATPSGRRAWSHRESGCPGPRRASRIPGPTQSPTVTAKAQAVDRCPVVHAPSLPRSAATWSATPSSRVTPAGNMPSSSRTIVAVSTATSGTPTAHQPRNETCTPICARMKPSPIRLGGVPIGVASPPTLDANAVASGERAATIMAYLRQGRRGPSGPPPADAPSHAGRQADAGPRATARRPPLVRERAGRRPLSPTPGGPPAPPPAGPPVGGRASSSRSRARGRGRTSPSADRPRARRRFRA
jgi:hypothetical protein